MRETAKLLGTAIAHYYVLTGLPRIVTRKAQNGGRRKTGAGNHSGKCVHEIPPDVFILLHQHQ
jgi:hypothetical protein